MTESPARLDDRHLLYVEQQSVSPQTDGRVLVAGDPVFLWRRSGERHELVEQDSLVGMVITPPSGIRSVVTPLPGKHLTSMRSAPLPDGWWLVVVAEVVPVPPPADPKVIALWSGETDGTSWRGVQKLPSVPDSLVMTTISVSPIAYRDGRALFSVKGLRGDQPRVVLYESSPTGWTATSIVVGTRSYVATALTASHELLAVVENDSTEQEDVNSLFIYAKPYTDSAWSRRTRLVRGFRSPVRDPLFDARSDGMLLGWRRIAENGRDDTAWSVRLNSAGEMIGPARTVTDGARLLYHAARGDRGVWALTDWNRPLDRQQLIEHDSTATPVDSIVNATSFGGLLGAAITSDFFVLVASRRGASPDDPAVISVIRTYPWRCQ